MNSFSTHEQSAPVRQRFAGAWSQLGARLAPDFGELVQRYAEPHRAYHTLDHIHECLGWLGASGQFAEHVFEVELALIYHDVVYEPLRADNEQRSAAFFRAHAQASRLPEQSAERIAVLIEGTASHRTLHGDGALVNDIDLAVLGASPQAFARYEQQIRAEFQHVSEPLFRAGREQVLRSFLQTLSIYSTPFFSQRLEAQASTYLSQAISALR